ncbi:MAG: hypothetical protein ACOY7U_02040 [Acidobacteriota bacterium]
MLWVALLSLLLAACKPGLPGKATPAPTPTAAEVAEGWVLTPEDMELYLAVKRKALSRLEEALDRLQTSGGDPVRELAELTVVEREAARALGADPQKFARIQEAVSRLVTLKGREEESLRLEQELQRNLEELEKLKENTKDPAASQFLEAQLKALRGELAKLATERRQMGGEQEQLQLLSRFRLEMAQLQARQDRLARRIREAMTASGKPKSGR